MTGLSATTPVARKPHRCWYCAETIHPGTRYLRTAGVCDGEFSAQASHLWCDEAARGPLGWWNDAEELDPSDQDFRDDLVAAGIATAEDVRRWCERGPVARQEKE